MSRQLPPTADEVIALLDLSPHPEGGSFRETYRDTVAVADQRAASTAIYFLLRAGEVSRWHRVDAAEGWHWYAGAPLELHIAHEGRRSVHRLGSDLLAGERPQAVVPPHAWQQARSLGGWTLVGCTVAPAFQFEGFELVRALTFPHLGARAILRTNKTTRHELRPDRDRAPTFLLITQPPGSPKLADAARLVNKLVGEVV